MREIAISFFFKLCQIFSLIITINIKNNVLTDSSDSHKNNMHNYYTTTTNHTNFSIIDNNPSLLERS